MRRLILALAVAGAGRRAYRLLARGRLTLDVGIGRRVRPLGPLSWEIAAGREIVLDTIADPYLGRTPRALEDKLQVWERGSDMVLAAHVTPVKCGTTTTHVAESFVLETTGRGCRLTWQGELDTDLWALGSRWGGVVARSWEKAVRASLPPIVAEAERRAGGEFGDSSGGERASA